MSSGNMRGERNGIVGGGIRDTGVQPEGSTSRRSSTPRQFPSLRKKASNNLMRDIQVPSSPLRTALDIHSNDLDVEPVHIDQTYSFPPSNSPSSSTAINMNNTSPISTAQRRISVTGRPRRPSSLLHEIQPPARRLSNHQVLLLTPFGGSLPDELSTGSGMRRESSSMGRLTITTTGLRRESTSSVTSGGPLSAGMGREPSIIPSPISPLEVPEPPPRARHLSFVNNQPSPLSSAPLTTIQSSSSGETSKPPSRQVSNQGDTATAEEEKEDEIHLIAIGVGIETVLMTRSNSLPILTLRELEQQQEKDAELGISRGSTMAWVSRDNDEDTLTSSNESDVSTSSSSFNSTSTPSSFTFNDPFASTGESIQIKPVATAPGYRYSPNVNDTRRQSDAPIISRNYSISSQASPRSKVDKRRPSAPVFQDHNSPSSQNPTPRARNDSLKVEETESPGGTPLPATRPRILRYKTSPARSNGLGLSIVVRPDDGSSSAGPSTGGSLGSGYRRPRTKNSKESVSASSTINTFERRQQHETVDEFGNIVQPRINRSNRGSWAPVDIIDGIDAILPGVNSRRISQISGSSGSARTSISIPRASISGASGDMRSTVMIENTKRLSLFEFGADNNKEKEGGRSRFDSVDSAFKHDSSGFGKSESKDLNDLNRFDTFPRRGSLALLSNVGNGMFGVWASNARERFSPGRRSSGSGSSESKTGRLGRRESELKGGDWYERRGSWAEGWKNT